MPKSHPHQSPRKAKKPLGRVSVDRALLMKARTCVRWMKDCATMNRDRSDYAKYSALDQELTAALGWHPLPDKKEGG
jgi:hypothetical protein